MRERQAWIDAARGLALALVVLVHTSLRLAGSGYDLSPWMEDLNLILDGFRMPTLVLISGLFATHVSSWTWRELFRRRVGPLAVVYVVWAPIAIVVIGSID